MKILNVEWGVSEEVAMKKEENFENWLKEKKQKKWKENIQTYADVQN